MSVVSPAVPSDVDISGLTTAIQTLSEQQTIANMYLNYIFSALLWIIIIIVACVLFKVLHNTLFVRNDFLN